MIDSDGLAIETIQQFAVRIDGNNRGFALGGDAGRMLFNRRKDAEKWALELQDHISNEVIVVPVTVSIQENRK